VFKDLLKDLFNIKFNLKLRDLLSINLFSNNKRGNNTTGNNVASGNRSENGPFVPLRMNPEDQAAALAFIEGVEVKQPWMMAVTDALNSRRPKGRG